MATLSPDVNESYIVICLLGLERIGEKADAVTRTFKFWYRIHRPDEFEQKGAEPLSVKVLAQWKVNKREFFSRYIAGLRQRGIN